MPFANVSISATITFDASTSLITYSDTSNWGAEGVPLSDVVGTLSILDPAGTTWNYGTFLSPILDLDGVSGLDNVTTLPGPIHFPKTSNYTSATIKNELHVRGTYTFTVVFQEVSSGDTITADIEADYCATAPKIAGEFEYNCLKEPLVMFRDGTNYKPSGETEWTITSRSIVLRDIKGNSWTTGASTVNWIGTGSSSAWTGAYSAELTATITRTVNLVVETCSIVETFTGDFQCLSACELKCLLEKGYNRTLTSKYQDKCDAEDKFQQAASRVTLAGQAQDCGDGDLLADLVKEVRKILGITESCCGDGQPTLITPITGTATAVTLAAGSYIDVGSAPNYTVAVNAAGTAILDDTVNTVVADGAGITVTGPVQTGSNPPTDTYTVTTATGVPLTEPEEWAGTLRITWVPGTTPTLSIVEESRYDTTTTFQALPWTLTHLAGSVIGAADITIADFLTSPASPDVYTPLIQPLSGVVPSAIMHPTCTLKTSGAGHTLTIEFKDAQDNPWDWFSLNLAYAQFGTTDFAITIHRKA